MLNLKGCPKCNGDLALRDDSYGSYWACLQCGRVPEVADQRLGVNELDDAAEVVAKSKGSNRKVSGM